MGALSNERLMLTAVFALAAGLRLAWVLALDFDPTTTGFHYDMTWYQLAGHQVAAGNGLTRYDGTATAVWPPGYPMLLGGIYRLTGGSFLAAQLANALLGGLAAVFTLLLGARLFGSGVGVVAGVLFAAFPDDIFFSPVILSEVFFGTVLTGVVLSFAILHSREGRPRLGYWFAFGMLVGAATLIRGITLAFLLVPLAMWWVSSRSLRVTAIKTAVAGLGLMCVLAPWTLRNYMKLGYPVLVATSIGRTLGHAHSETGGPTLQALQRRVKFGRQFEHLPQPQREIETMRAWQRMTTRYMWEHPWEELRLIPTRFYHLYKHGHEGFLLGRDKRESVEPAFRPRTDRAIRIGADVYYFGVVTLAFIGLLRMLADRTRLLMPLTVLYFTALHSVLFPGNPRYHSAVIPFLCIAAASVLVALRDRLRPA
ncbi:MAG: hypothetical protein E2O73_09225 [Deltaproteobacteria bacterium]|nr:MAG: hypothetical protein E2O73_09225 [Deltaproteobacteria bacterium]